MPKARADREDAPRSMGAEHYADLLDRVGTYRTSGKWLDVGGGIGTFLHRARARFPGFRTYLSEMSRVSAEFARDHYGLTVLSDPPDTLRARGWQFDVISIIAVLEHLPHPRTAMAAILDLLAPGGALVITVPNFTRLNRWLSHGDSWSVTAPYHVSLFDRRNLPRMLRDLAPVRVREVWESGPPSFNWIHLARITECFHTRIPNAARETQEVIQRTPFTRWQRKLIPQMERLDNQPWMRRLVERLDGQVLLNVLVERPAGAAVASVRRAA
jgi:SAM-dependent methyltransferase